MDSRTAVFMTSKELLDFVTNNPKGTKLSGDPIIICNQTLDLGGRDILWLPDDIITMGDLIIECCQKLQELPVNLFVGGDLYMCYSKIRAITDDLQVCGDIHAEGMDLDFPKDYIVYRGLYLNRRDGSPDSPPLHLRNIAKVDGVLDVRGRVIAEWPRCVTLIGSLLADEISGVIIKKL